VAVKVAVPYDGGVTLTIDNGLVSGRYHYFGHQRVSDESSETVTASSIATGDH